MAKQHIIELNGKRYDALTGKMVGEQAAMKSAHKAPLQPVTSHNLDGFAKKPERSGHTAHPQARSVQKSHTLMRTTVHKPISHKLHAVATVVDQKPAEQPVHMSSSVLRSKLTPHSPLIRKFSLNPDDNEHKVAPDSRKQMPSPAPTLSKAAASAATVSVSVNPLHQAIANATSHQQPKLKRPGVHKRVANRLHISPRVLSGGSLLVAALLLIGFFSYQNIPNLKMHLAASRAGVHGTLPAYQPPGFHLNNISYKPGEINVSFVSNSDGRNFRLSQVASAWNSDTLRDKLKNDAKTTNPMEVPDNGKTLFIYNDSNVTWVDGGILYKIEGDSKLNSDQLLRLANSI